MVQNKLFLQGFHIQEHSPERAKQLAGRIQFHRNRCLLRGSDQEILQNHGDSQPRLHHTKSHADTIARSLSERNPSIRMSGGHVLLGEAVRIKLLWLGVNFGITMNGQDWNQHLYPLVQNDVRIGHLVRNRDLAEQCVHYRVLTQSFCGD